MRGLWGDWRIPAQSKSSTPLSAVAFQSGWVLSSRMTSTGSFWRMTGSKEEQRKRGCVLKRSTSRSRVSGFLHKSCSDQEESEWIHSSSQVFFFFMTWKVNDLSEQEDERRAEGPRQVVRKISDLVHHGVVIWLCRKWELEKKDTQRWIDGASSQYKLIKFRQRRQYLSSHQWEESNSEGPPVCCVIVRTSTQDFRSWLEQIQELK